MTTNNYLRFQIAVLLAQYGERTVLETLSSLLEECAPVPNLEVLLLDIRKVGHARTKKPRVGEPGSYLTRS